jgi:translation initiation factor IF-3
LRINHEIRARELRVISSTGEQLGVLPLAAALAAAERQGLDLIEIVPTANPPVAKIMDYGKFRYEQTKRERESKKSQHQVKVKEVKISPNISEHDLEVKLRQAHEFLEKGNKVKLTLMFRGREMMHQDVGLKLMERAIQTLAEVSMVETHAKLFGRFLTMVLAPATRKKVRQADVK